MDTITRTFPLGLTSTVTSTIIELCHFRDMAFDADERVGIYLEAFFCNMSLKSFNLGVYPDFDGDESEAEKMAKFNASENKSQKLGLRILTKKNNTGDWREKAEIILVNRGRKDYFDLLIPYLAKAQVRLLEKNDAIGIQLVDYGNGLLKLTDFIEIEAAFTITISKKNNIEALQARIATLELALEGRLINLPSNTLLGRNTGIGAVEQVPQSKFATPAMIDQAIVDWVGTSPTNLNTLLEISAALGNDPNFATTITNLIATKAPLASSLQLTNRSNTVSAPFDANNWVNSSSFASIKWIDGGYTNLNVPTNTGMIFQFDSLFGTVAAGKYRVQHYYSGIRYFVRIENNTVWGGWRETTTVAV
ncbi:hypothetical protein QUA56_19045 [Microcoleus sp. N3A4]|uniref:hypothetical protein n=1 Tax=Cyanophyceae TaxID=3028117 RepID=UPI002FD0B028